MTLRCYFLFEFCWYAYWWFQCYRVKLLKPWINQTGLHAQFKLKKRISQTQSVICERLLHLRPRAHTENGYDEPACSFKENNCYLLSKIKFELSDKNRNFGKFVSTLANLTASQHLWLFWWDPWSYFKKCDFFFNTVQDKPMGFNITVWKVHQGFQTPHCSEPLETPACQVLI